VALNAYQLPAPADWQAFERFARDLFASHWNDDRAQLNGRTGQPQCGVDVCGINGKTGLLEGVQCKGKDGRYGHTVGVDELRQEVAKATKFQPAISHYYLVTSGVPDVSVQQEARLITQAHQGKGAFSVSVLAWDELLRMLEEHKPVARKHYRPLRVALAEIDAKAQLIAICHQSFQNTSDLFHKIDPIAADEGFFPIEMDAAPYFNEGVLDIRSAIREQRYLVRDIASQLRAYPEATVAYFGIAHIPLVLHAGTTASTKNGVGLYELDAASGTWVPLASDEGPDLGVELVDLGGPVGADHAVVTVEVSASIHAKEVAWSLPGPWRHLSVRVKQPKRGVVTHHSQTREIAYAFREAMDRIHNENPRAIRHLFVSAPVSVCFRLGQMVSQTMHRKVLAYNYSQRSDPPYQWAIDLVAPDGDAQQVWTWEGAKNV
jgi:hypothetical protein